MIPYTLEYPLELEHTIHLLAQLPQLLRIQTCKLRHRRVERLQWGRRQHAYVTHLCFANNCVSQLFACMHVWAAACRNMCMGAAACMCGTPSTRCSSHMHMHASIIIIPRPCKHHPLADRFESMITAPMITASMSTASQDAGTPPESLTPNASLSIGHICLIHTQPAHLPKGWVLDGVVVHGHELVALRQTTAGNGLCPLLRMGQHAEGAG